MITTWYLHSHLTCARLCQSCMGRFSFLARNGLPRVHALDRGGIGMLLVIVVLAVPGAGLAQTTAWGDPDLQGVWTNQTPTPLERPAALGGKEYLTEAEAAEFERTSLTRLLGGLGNSGLSEESELSGELTEIWLETQNGRVPPSRRTSLIVAPPDGRIPFTSEGRTRWETAATVERMIAGGDVSLDAAQTRTYFERCLTAHLLQIPSAFYNNYHQILQTPGAVVILSEAMHILRVVPLDRRGHLDSRIHQWEGDSRGWWEDETLVVDTTNFKEEKLFRGSTAQLRMVERFTRLDDDTLRYQLTVSDPVAFETPWTVENALRSSQAPLFEFACHEGNYSMVGILAGARAEGR